MPEFLQTHPKYEKLGLRDLCEQLHDFNKAHDVAHITTSMYLSSMAPAMIPSQAWAKLAHREVERVPIDDLEGRVTAMLVTPYPPGIPLLIPGERFNKEIVRYLKFAREINRLFPGFEHDIHGLVTEKKDGKTSYYVDCVVE
jgi:arginine decarboxylase